MSDWQVTATTIQCPAVGEEVTIMVYKDWSVKCAGAQQYEKPDKTAGRRLKHRGRPLKRELRCPGTDCPEAQAYKARLMQEEKEKEARASF